MWSKWRGTYGTIAAIFMILGFIILFLAINFALFTFGYWIITLILATFFNFILPFSWWYSLGVWLIVLVAGAFIIPTGRTLVSRE